MMDATGAYGGGKAGGAFDPQAFIQRPPVIVRAVCWVSIFIYMRTRKELKIISILRKSSNKTISTLHRDFLYNSSRTTCSYSTIRSQAKSIK